MLLKIYSGHAGRVMTEPASERGTYAAAGNLARLQAEHNVLIFCW